MSLCTSYEGVSHLGRAVLGRPDVGRHHRIDLFARRVGKSASEAEVAKFGGFETGGDEDVARLDVAVELPGGVKADERAGDV